MAQNYRFERNGVTKVAKLVHLNDKAKLATLEMEDGTMKSIALSTFKRWWKPCDDVVTEQEQPKEEEQQDNEEKQDNVVNEEVSNADAKNDAVEKKVKKEKIPAIDVEILKQKAIEIANKFGFEEKLYENLPNIVVLKIAGKGKAEVRFSKKGFVVNVKEEVLEGGVEYKKLNNYYLPATLTFSGYTDYEKELNNILERTGKWYSVNIDTNTAKKINKTKEEQANG